MDARSEPGMPFHYYLFHKPYGCVTARRDALYPTVMDYFRELQNPELSPVGRLDRETTGLLLVTDDGKWNQRMIHPAYHKEKEYTFLLMGILTDEKKEMLEKGILLTGSEMRTRPARIAIEGYTTFEQIRGQLHPEIEEKLKHNLPATGVTAGRIILSEGRKNQIRRMMKAAGCCVIDLKRIRVDGYVLPETLPPGAYLELPEPSAESL